MLRLAERAEMSQREATAIIEAVQAAVARWQDFAAQAGVSKINSSDIAAFLPGLSA